MNNTEIIQSIRAEIERLIAMNKTRNGFPAGTMCAVRIEAYENFLSFLSTLEEKSEKPVPNDLEEAAKVYFENPENSWQVKDVFKAGAKWQKQHDAELIEIAYNDGITIGMTKQKEWMMREAVEGEVMLNPYPTICLDDCKDYNFNDNQKVRIIIVKED